MRDSGQFGPRLERRRTYWRWAFFLCLAVVLWLSLTPARVAMPPTGWDKALHALAFMVLALLGGRSYPQRNVQVLLGLLAYGGAIELLQDLTSYRSAEWMDFVADGFGLLLGWASARFAPRMSGPR